LQDFENISQHPQNYPTSSYSYEGQKKFARRETNYEARSRNKETIPASIV